MALKETITQRREKLTEKVRQARQAYYSIEEKVRYEVRKNNPGLKEADWVAYYKLVESNPELQKAEAVLQAYCEAANIMGAEIE